MTVSDPVASLPRSRHGRRSLRPSRDRQNPPAQQSGETQMLDAALFSVTSNRSCREQTLMLELLIQFCGTRIDGKGSQFVAWNLDAHPHIFERVWGHEIEKEPRLSQGGGPCKLETFFAPLTMALHQV